MEGKIIKIVSNQYTVVKDGEFFMCIPKGKLRLGITPYVGDSVEFSYIDDRYVIESINDRHNYLDRPSIANVDQALVVMSVKDPDFSSQLIDRLCFLIRQQNIEPIICLTKMDLLTDNDKEITKEIDEYEKSGQRVVKCDKNNIDEQLESILKGKITVLTGQSGVGKSTLLNTIDPSFMLQTQEISKALGRGKHTTRHTELHEVCGGYVADTPGFSSLDFDHIEASELMYDVIEFKPFLNKCRFNDCLHQNEPGCAIKKACEDGKIPVIRYKHYLECLNIIQQKKEKY